MASSVPLAVDPVKGKLGGAVVGGFFEGHAGGHEFAGLNRFPVDAVVDAGEHHVDVVDGLVAAECQIEMADGLAVVLAGQFDLRFDEMEHAFVGGFSELVDAGLGVGDEALAGEDQGGGEGGVAVAAAGSGNKISDIILPAVGLLSGYDFD